MTPKVLVGVITHEGEKYCRDAFVKSLQSLSYPAFDVAFATNSGSLDKMNLEKHLDLFTKGEKTVMETDAQGLHVTEDICALNREMIRTFFLAGDWTHLFFIDSDVFVPRNSIEIMLSHEKSLLTGVYLNGFKANNGQKVILPVLWAKDKEGNRRQASIVDVKIPRLFPILEAGLGCCLIEKAVLEAVGFPKKRPHGVSEDLDFFRNAKKAGFTLWVDTRIQCPQVKFPLGDERNRLYDLRNYQMNVKKS